MPELLRTRIKKVGGRVLKKRSVTKKKSTVRVYKPLSNGLLSLEDSVAKAIETIKKSDYKGRFIKVELEAEMSREWDEDDCRDWLLENVSEKAKNALVYSQFYNDGSVDSEFTFTIPIDDPYIVLEYIKAFKELSKVCGHVLEVEGAGMHIAILNSTDGNYPSGNSLSIKRTANFSDSMTSLLPALYFLGTSDAKSRGLHFRQPMVCKSRGGQGKYQAISHLSNVFEYRVFDTCYDKPEAFLDFFCVIAKTMQFYKLTPVTLPFFGKIGTLLLPDSGYHLSRFYGSIKHIEALDLGLAILKPDHKSIEQLKQERGFKIDKSTLENKDKKLTLQWKAEYAGAKKAFSAAVGRRRSQLESYFDDEKNYGGFADTKKDKWVEDALKTWVEQEYGYMDTVDKFVDKKRQDTLASTGRCYSVNV